MSMTDAEKLAEIRKVIKGNTDRGIVIALQGLADRGNEAKYVDELALDASLTINAINELAKP